MYGLYLKLFVSLFAETINTSVTEYQADKNSVFVYSATASLNMKHV